MDIQIDFKGLLMLFIPFFMMDMAVVQSPDFMVYYVQGKVKKMNAGKSGMLKKGDRLYDTDMIGVSAGSQVILICQHFNNIKLDKPDTIRLNTLEKQCGKNKDTFILAYFHFIWDELFDKKPDAQEYLHNIGAVSRGGPVQRLPLWLDTINYLNGGLKIKLDNGSDPLLVKVFNNQSHEKLLFKMTIAADKFNLDSLTSRLKMPGVYYWTISGYQPLKPSGYYLRIWKNDEYIHAVGSVLNAVIKTSPAETAYMSGFMMEKSSFLSEAGKYYKLACKLRPQNKTYQTANNRFL